MITKDKTTWRTVRLGDLVVLKGGVSGPFGSNIKSSFFCNVGVPVIRGNNLTIGIKEGRYIDSGYIFLDEEKANELANAEALPGDIIITARGTLGQTGIIPAHSAFPRYIISANQLRFRIDQRKADPMFIYYQLSSKNNVKQIQNNGVNVGVPNFNLGAARNIELSIPNNIKEQNWIVGILSTFDDKIENNNRIIKTLDEMARAIFKEWFIDFRFPEYRDVKFIESELGKIPEGWEVRNVLDVVKRISVGKKFENKTALPGGKVPILDQGQSGFIGYHNEEPGVVATINEPVIVFTNHTCNYRLVTYPFSAIQNVLPYVGTNGYSTLFVYFLTRDKIKMQEYKGHWPEFEQQIFTIPPIALARRYIEIVKPMVKKMVETDNENNKLAATRDILLSRLMSGELNV